MKVWKYALGWLAFAGLLLLAGSGVYDAAGGIRASARYLQWYGEHYGAIPVSLVISAYMLGVFRGTAALACAAAGAAGIARGRLRLRYFLALGLCASWYVQAVVHKAYKGSQAEDWVQLWIAVFCLGALIVYRLACIYREELV